jgi:two-component system NtrC family sensor kinase
MSTGTRNTLSATKGMQQADQGDKLQSHYRRLWLYSVAVTAFVALTPLVIMTLINYYQYKKALEAEMEYPISRLVSNARRSIGDFLEERRAALQYVARSESYDDLCDADQLNRVFTNMKQSFGGFVDLRVIDSDGTQRAYVGRYEQEGENYKEQDWFQEVRLKGTYVSDVFLGYRKFPHFVIAVRKDSEDEGTFYVLEATIDIEALEHYISSLSQRPSSDAFLINREGILQTHSRHNGQILEQCPIAPPPFSAHTEVHEIDGPRGQPTILGYAYIEKSPFILAVLNNSEDATKNWLYLRGNIIGLSAVSICFILGVVLLSSRYLVKRIRDADHHRDKALLGIAYTNKMASIGRMAAGVAHEINNPLAIINENAGLLKDLVDIKDKSLDRERLAQIATTVQKSVKRCGTITHRLLGFAKRMEPRTEDIALVSLLEETLSFHGKEANYRSIAVNFDVAEDLPVIHSDRGLLQQVFVNILSNAFAAVPDNHGRIDISLQPEGDNMVAVTISDNGPGIPQEHMDYIFEPFFSTKAEHGTGLGLSITLGIVAKLGGQLDVQSTPGEGASFTVRLPVTRRS